MEGFTRQSAVLFVDIAGSTALQQRLGTVEATARLQRLLGELTDIVGQHGGRVVKSDGDDLLVVFDQAPIVASAARAAVAAQRRAQESGLSLYAGLHAGTVELRQILGRTDVLGQPVNMAARLHKLVPDAPGTIFLSAEMKQMLPQDLIGNAEPFGQRPIKGIGTVDVWTLGWQEDDNAVQTRFAVVTRGVTSSATPLQLRLGQQRVRLAAEDPPLLVGRVKDCQLRIDDPELKTSSRHLRIETRGGRWFVRDQSRNGTWLRDATTGEETLLLGIEMVLPISGHLCLGRKLADDPTGSFTLQFGQTSS